MKNKKKAQAISQPTEKTPGLNLFPTDLYNQKTLFSLSGSSLAVWLFTTVTSAAFNITLQDYKWVGLIVALAISYIGVLRINKLSLELGTIAFFNGLLIFVTASGIDAVNHGFGNNEARKDNRIASLLNIDGESAWWPTKYLLEENNELTNEIKVVKNELKELQDFARDSTNEDWQEIETAIDDNDSGEKSPGYDELLRLYEDLKDRNNQLVNRSSALQTRLNNKQKEIDLLKAKECPVCPEAPKQVSETVDLKSVADKLGFSNFNTEIKGLLTRRAVETLLRTGYFSGRSWTSLLSPDQQRSKWYYFSDQIAVMKELQSNGLIETFYGNEDIGDWEKRVLNLPGTEKTVYRCSSGLFSETQYDACPTPIKQKTIRDSGDPTAAQIVKDGYIRLTRKGRQVYEVITEYTLNTVSK